MAETLDDTTPLGNEVFSYDVFIQDGGIMNQCNFERGLENDEFVITKTLHQELEKKSYWKKSHR